MHSSSVHNKFGHEQGYETRDISQAKGVTAMPQLIHVEGKGKYLMLCEADLYGDSYAGSAMRCIGNNTLQMCFAPRDEGVTITTDFVSPWRFGVYGTLGDIVESDMTEKLGTPPEGDFSWVEPGVTAWTWLSEGAGGQNNREIIKDYIDLSYEMGWKYLILDEGWNTSGRNPYCKYYNWFASTVEYAKERGVGLIAWVYTPNIKRLNDGTFDLSFIEDYAKAGIKGVKIDFFDSEDQETINLYDALYKECAKYKLIVNCHGANIPKGERRTYPNVINREAALTEEYGGLFMNTAMYWPYTRNVSGPIDVTPRLYPTGGATTVAQMAVNIIFESGMPCMASKSSEYRAFSANSFYKHLPATWDDIHFIDGSVGSWASIARSYKGVWYAATMTQSAKTNLTMSLDFLGEGKYYAVIYKEASRTDVATEVRVVTNKDTLKYDVLQGGGYIVKFVSEKDAGSYLPTGIETKSEISIIEGKKTALEYKLIGESIEIDEVTFLSSDTSIVAVDAKGVLHGQKPGTATVKITSIANEAITKTVTVTVTSSPIVLNPVFTMSDPNVDPNYLPGLDFNNPNKIYLPAQFSKDGKYTELRYPVPDGDFKISIRISNFVTVNGCSGGVVIRSGDEYVEIVRGHNGASYINCNTSAKGSVKIADDFKGNYVINIERVGDIVTVSSGRGTATMAKRAEISAGDSLTMGMFAVTTDEKNVANVDFVGLTVNENAVPFSVDASAEKETVTVEGYKAYVTEKEVQFYIQFAKEAVGKEVVVNGKAMTVGEDGVMITLAPTALEEKITVKYGDTVCA